MFLKMSDINAIENQNKAFYEIYMEGDDGELSGYDFQPVKYSSTMEEATEVATEFKNEWFCGNNYAKYIITNTKTKEVIIEEEF